jgi:hypothetical protein
MIQENPYLQYFCGLRGYGNSRPAGPSMMVHFRKRFTEEMLGEINELLISGSLQEAERQRKRGKTRGQKREKETASPASEVIPCEAANASALKTLSPEDDPSGNGGTLTVNATCAPGHIKCPQDTELLNGARQKTEEMRSELHEPFDGPRPRTCSKRAKTECNRFSRKRKKASQEIRKIIGKELNCLRRNLAMIAFLLVLGGCMSKKLMNSLEAIKILYAQQKEMYRTGTHRIADRIVSISQPWLRPIVRGKTDSPVEFGAKLDISVVNGFTRLEHISFTAYNESAF